MKKYPCPKEGCAGVIGVPDTVEEIEALLKNQPRSPTLDEIDQLMKGYQSKKHKPADHETGDALLDCPECRQWLESTGKRWRVSFPKEPTGEKEPEPKEPPEFELGSFIAKRRK